MCLLTVSTRTTGVTLDFLPRTWSASELHHPLRNISHTSGRVKCRWRSELSNLFQFEEKSRPTREEAGPYNISALLMFFEICPFWWELWRAEDKLLQQRTHVPNNTWISRQCAAVRHLFFFSNMSLLWLLRRDCRMLCLVNSTTYCNNRKTLIDREESLAAFPWKRALNKWMC